jgi:hypothetical protein
MWGAVLIAGLVILYAYYVSRATTTNANSLRKHAPEQYDRALRATDDNYTFAKHMYDLKMRLPNDLALENTVQELIYRRFPRDRPYVPAS